MAFSVIHKIGYYQIIVDIPHSVYNAQLIVKAVGNLFFRAFAVNSVQTFKTLIAKIFKMIPVAYIEPRQLYFAELKCNAAFFGYFHRVFNSLGRFGEKRRHFLGGF